MARFNRDSVISSMLSHLLVGGRMFGIGVFRIARAWRPKDAFPAGLGFQRSLQIGASKSSTAAKASGFRGNSGPCACVSFCRESELENVVYVLGAIRFGDARWLRGGAS